MLISIPRHYQRIQAFTIVELLVVVAIIAILAVLLFPVFQRVHEKAMESKCLTLIHSVYTAAMLYTNDNNGRVVPAQIGTYDASGKQIRSDLWPTQLVPYYGEKDNANARRFSCPAWQRDRKTDRYADKAAYFKNPYQWGYAINETPGYEGSSSKPPQKQNSRIRLDADGNQTAGTEFRLVTITNKKNRLFFCDSYEWHVSGSGVNPASSGDTLAAYDRHGENRCNVIFFDGHATSLNPKQLDTAIYDPENFTESTD
ncbi:MAG: type II secretion system protein [Chthoniobacterales bacterium]